MQASHSRPSIVPVCERCRQRKQKCQQTMEPCLNCVDAGQQCTILDPATKRTIPRTYALQLEAHLAILKLRVSPATKPTSSPRESETTFTSPSSSETTPSPGRYLGASSGLAFVESAIHLAETRGIIKYDSSLAPEEDASTEVPLDLDELLPAQPWPAIVPNEAKMMRIFNSFLRAQWQYDILRKEEFANHLSQHLLQMDQHPSQQSHVSNVIVTMVCAIGLHHSGSNSSIGSNAFSLANSYHEKALSLLGPIVRERSTEGLQALLLILLFSMVDPQKPIVWHLLGAALRLTTDLGLHALGPSEHWRPAPTEDLGPRLFWSIYSLDRAVGNTLGRPTAMQDIFVSTPLPQSSGPVALHCFQIRNLQSEAVDRLYHCIQPVPVNYTTDIMERLAAWRAAIPLEHCSRLSEDWFHHAYYNMVIFVHRPSPGKPQPSGADLVQCFEAASQVIRFYSKLQLGGAIDTTWMSVHWLFLAAVTHLYCIWENDDLRNNCDWAKTNDDIQACSTVLSAMAEKWKSGRKMIQIYRALSKGTLDRYVRIVPVALLDETKSMDRWPAPVTINDAARLRPQDMMLDYSAQFWLA